MALRPAGKTLSPDNFSAAATDAAWAADRAETIKAGGETNQYPRHQLKIVYNGGMGAAHYTNGDPEHGPVGAWLAHTDRPPTNPPEVIYDPWDPD